ncbi:hypothetical protein JHK87_012418 [Glycine soja]|nr:hypothetical protein JHK87_012418 [Glycine soja]
MNQMLEAWKLVPDVSDEVSPPPKSQSSSKGHDFNFSLQALMSKSQNGLSVITEGVEMNDVTTSKA